MWSNSAKNRNNDFFTHLCGLFLKQTGGMGSLLSKQFKLYIIKNSIHICCKTNQCTLFIEH